jgi:DNA-binding transcriptional MerR regulator
MRNVDITQWNLRMSQELLTTGPFALEGGCRPQTVRKYERLELLLPVARDTAGRRLYSRDQVPVLRELLASRIANRGFVRRT